MKQFYLEFEEYCKSPNVNSGKAKSYANAIKYLFEFMNFSTINDSEYLKLQQLKFLIKDKTSSFYIELLDFLVKRKQSSYLLNGFIQAALSYFFRFYLFKNHIANVDNQNKILIEKLNDNSLNAEFLYDKLRRELPTDKNFSLHNYIISITNGTAKQSINKIKSGRIAEKYFINFLLSKGFRKNVDFLDVANNNNYGFDILLNDVGMEVKNIRSGNFFLTDNEIAYLINGITNLVFVDIDNGIWLLKNNAVWLLNIIKNIQEVREYCSSNYNHLDLTDIKIRVDETLKEDLIDLTILSKSEIIRLLECC